MAYSSAGSGQDAGPVTCTLVVNAISLGDTRRCLAGMALVTGMPGHSRTKAALKPLDRSRRTR